MHTPERTTDTAGSLPTAGFLRLPQILAVVPIGKSTWWAGVRDGRYPAPVRPSPFGRVTVWRASDIREWLATLSRVQSP